MVSSPNEEAGSQEDEVVTSLQLLDVAAFEDEDDDQEPSPVAKWLRPQPEAAGWDKIITAIVPGVLFVSGLGGARDFEAIKQHSICSILDIACKDPRAEAGMELPAVAEEGSALNILKPHGVTKVIEMHLSDSSADAEEEKPAIQEALRVLDDLTIAGPWRGLSTVRADDLQDHIEVEFVMEEGDEDDDGSGWIQ